MDNENNNKYFIIYLAVSITVGLIIIGAFIYVILAQLHYNSNIEMLNDNNDDLLPDPTFFATNYSLIPLDCTINTMMDLLLTYTWQIIATSGDNPDVDVSIILFISNSFSHSTVSGFQVNLVTPDGLTILDTYETILYNPNMSVETVGSLYLICKN